MENLNISNGHHGKNTMRAVIWEGKVKHVAVRTVPRPKILAKEDAIVRITTAAICGSDLHTYRGLLGSVNPPWGLGHEAMGIVAEVGAAVGSLKVGDRVIVPASPDDGKLNVEPVQGFEAFGFGTDFGNLDGAQGEWST
jgi:threonine dehydrogenase-like Zn-dependent dehydrogenase